jgi:hypothetical protein
MRHDEHFEECPRLAPSRAATCRRVALWPKTGDVPLSDRTSRSAYLGTHFTGSSTGIGNGTRIADQGRFDEGSRGAALLPCLTLSEGMHMCRYVRVVLPLRVPDIGGSGPRECLHPRICTEAS